MKISTENAVLWTNESHQKIQLGVRSQFFDQGLTSGGEGDQIERLVMIEAMHKSNTN